MNRTEKLLALGAIMFCASAMPAHAQFKTTELDVNQLPRGDKFYRHRLQVQIVNEKPDVTNTLRGPDPQKTLVIEMPQMQAPQVEEIYISNPGINGSGVRPGRRPGTISLDVSKPPVARFESNMPPNGFANPNLAPGQTTNLLARQGIHGRLNPSSGSSQPVSRRLVLPKSQAAQQPPEVMQYERPSSAQGTSTSRTTTAVSGKLERFSLLNNSSKQK